MQIGVLGPLLVQRDGAPVTPRGQRPRDVLAVLLQRRGQSVPPEAILDLVWGHGPSGAQLSVAAVHTVIARLRRHLGVDAVETHDLGYRLTGAATTDAEAFVERVRRARGLPADQAVPLYREALALWRGTPAFDGISVDLVLSERVRLDELRSAAIEDLAAALLDPAAAGHGGEAAAEEAWELAAEASRQNPLRERPHALAMVAAYRLGRQAEALEIYRLLRLRLREELGIDPSPALTTVHAQVLAQDPALAPGSSSQRSADGHRPVGAIVERSPARVLARCVPVPSNPTIGRDAEVEAVLAALRQGHRLVTVLGPGGVGKSRVLAEVGSALLSSHEVAYLDLSGAEALSPAELAEASAMGFGVALAGQDPVAAVASMLAASDLVILIDEAEWSVGSVAALGRRLLDDCPGLRFVVTSRVPLEIVGERRVVLGPLACPAPEASVAEIEQAPAVRLLRDRLGDEAAGPALTDADHRALARIVRRVDGLPLALELVAGHAASHTLAELVELIEAPLDVRADDRDRTPRHRSLRDTLTWSFDRLDPVQRKALRRLSVFAGPFDPAAAKAVIGPLGRGVAAAGDGTDAVLRRLIREGHVAADRRGSVLRARLLRTVRDLALEELVAAGELDATRRRHREWFAARWRSAPLHDDLVEDVRAHYEDYLEALRQAMAAGDAAGTADLAITLGRWWVFTECLGAGRRWTSRVLDSGLLDGCLGGVSRARVMVLHASMGQQGPRSDAAAQLVEAIEVLAAAEDDDWLAQALTAHVVGMYLAGDFEQAVEVATRLVQHARVRSRIHLPEGLSALAAACAACGRAEEANRAAGEAWQLIRAEPSTTGTISVVAKIALAHLESGESLQALVVLEDAIATAGALVGSMTVDVLVINAGWAALGCGRPRLAVGYFVQGLGAAPGVDPGWTAFDGDLPAGPVPGPGEGNLGWAESFVGLGCALVALGDPRAESTLVRAQAVRRDVDLQLSPWQQGRLELALATLPATSAADR
ncbi:MAG: BTAD domain-containing putative transcriptional regulator [Kineosporiaceae bacterium]